jgi:AbrB family looped-hinge helix DNA binding protein
MSLVVQVEYMGKKVTFAVEVQKHKNRIVIPKKKADELDLKPGDYLKITAEKITAEE